MNRLERAGFSLLLALALLLPVSAAPYWIGSQSDRIVVYRAEDPEPVFTSQPVVPLLPREVQQRLAKGIVVEDEDTLGEILGNLTS